jgi:hypothetical protein
MRRWWQNLPDLFVSLNLIAIKKLIFSFLMAIFMMAVRLLGC